MKKIFLIALPLFIFSCNKKTYNDNFIKIEGKTQGTTFHVNYLETNALAFDKEIDSIFSVIDFSLSTYNDLSVISKFNFSDTGARIDEHVVKVFLKSREIHRLSNGAFDPTIKPLVDLWGFGEKKINFIDSIDKKNVDSIMNFIGLGKVTLFEKKRDSVFETLDEEIIADGDFFLLKDNPSVQLDFNAIAQGYTVDVVASFLESRGVKNYLVEIGGELRTRGKNHQGECWKIGIDQPADEPGADRPLQVILSINDNSLATSGNYRNFFLKDGVKFSHTIDTKTGFPVQQNPTMLSVSVLTSDCMSADGFATGLMALGLEKAKELLLNCNYLQAYIVYDENGKWKTFMTEKMNTFIDEKK